MSLLIEDRERQKERRKEESIYPIPLPTCPSNPGEARATTRDQIADLSVGYTQRSWNRPCRSLRLNADSVWLRQLWYSDCWFKRKLQPLYDWSTLLLYRKVKTKTSSSRSLQSKIFMCSLPSLDNIHRWYTIDPTVGPCPTIRRQIRSKQTDSNPHCGPKRKIKASRWYPYNYTKSKKASWREKVER